ncbi:MAG: hypothetical protein J2P37_16145 [Ktedonobacteraceae bacterium]|nr:hypothetical protein [Ktedonobacteraceae bacterium]MBO0792908.1 hypothetical protein [Ktedonobacteraceae bacterium]
MQQVTALQQLAMFYDLGQFRAEFKPSTADRLIMLSVVLLIAFVGIVMTLSIVLNAHPFSPLMLFPFFLFSVFVPLTCLRSVRWVVRNRKLRVFAHEHGFVYVGLRETRAIRWDHIAFVWHEVAVSQGRDSNGNLSISFHHEYRLQCLDGSTLVLDDIFSGLERLGKMVEWESARFLLPEVQDRFSSGQPVAFGELSVDQSGVVWHGQRLPWQAFVSMGVVERRGSIHLNTINQGQVVSWATISSGEIPNTEVLKALIRPYVRV